MADYHRLDLANCTLFMNQRVPLYIINRAMVYFPQIVSKNVKIEIHPATADDYEFHEEMRDNAIVVKVSWLNCNDSLFCYPTYPNGKVCTKNSTPIIFPSGDKTNMIACSPVCFASQRIKALRSTFNNDDKLLFFDKQRKSENVTNFNSTVYDKYMPNNANVYGEMELKDNIINYKEEYEIGKFNKPKNYNPIHKSFVKDLPESECPDIPILKWNQSLKQCQMEDASLMQFIMEPFHRDNSHSKCKLTNFDLGDDLERYTVNKYDARYGDLNEGDEGYSGRMSKAYCGAFLKEQTVDGGCTSHWWNDVISTLLGDAIIRITYETATGWQSCNGNIKTERNNPVEFSEFADNCTLSRWARNVNVNFRLPPPNIRLSDLGLFDESKKIGNLKYWTSLDGGKIVSRLPFIRSIRGLNFNVELKNQPSNKYKRINTNRFRRNDKLDDFGISSYLDGGDNLNDEKFRLLKHYEKIEKKKVTKIKRDTEKQIRDGIKRNLDQGQPIDSNINQLLRICDQNKLYSTFINKTDDIESNHDNNLNNNVFSEIETEKLEKVRNYLKTNPDIILKILNYKTKDFNDEEYKHFLKKRNIDSTNENINSNETDPSNWETIWENIKGMVDPDNWDELIKEIAIQIGIEAFRHYAGKFIKSRFNRLLLLSLKYTAGKMSTKLFIAIMKVQTTRLITMAVLNTRLLLIIGSVASVVGVIVAAIEIVAFILDLILLSNWDPGSYKNEFDVKMLKETMISWLKGKKLYGIDEVLRKPVNLLYLLISRVDGGSNTSGDDKSEEYIEKKDGKQSKDKSPLYFEPQWWNQGWEKCFEREYEQDNNEKTYGFYTDETKISNETNNLNIKQYRLEAAYDENFFYFVIGYMFKSTKKYNALGQLINLEDDVFKFDDKAASNIFLKQLYEDVYFDNNKNVRAIQLSTLTEKNYTTTIIGFIGIGISLVAIFFKKFILSVVLLTLTMIIIIIYMLYPLDITSYIKFTTRISNNDYINDSEKVKFETNTSDLDLDKLYVGIYKLLKDMERDN